MRGSFGLRLVSALVLIPLALVLIYAGGVAFTALVAAAGAMGLWEWGRMCTSNAAASDRFETALWLAGGAVYVVAAAFALVWLRGLADGAAIVLWLFLVVWASDMGAFAAGRLIGGPRLAPAISPKKTWSGALGGVGLSAATAVAFAAVFGSVTAGLLAGALGGALSVVAQLGDLVESAAKRRFRVKDSGILIPGHGGVLDRVDALCAASIALAAALLIDERVAGLWM